MHIIHAEASRTYNKRTSNKEVDKRYMLFCVLKKWFNLPSGHKWVLITVPVIHFKLQYINISTELIGAAGPII